MITASIMPRLRGVRLTSAMAQSICTLIGDAEPGKKSDVMSHAKVQQAPAALAARKRLQLPANGSNTTLPCEQNQALILGEDHKTVTPFCDIYVEMLSTLGCNGTKYHLLHVGQMASDKSGLSSHACGSLG